MSTGTKVYGPPLAAALLGWVLRDYTTSTLWSHAWNLFYSFLPLWIGLVVYALGWLARDYWNLRRWVGCDGIQYNETIRLWVGSHEEFTWPYIHKRSLDDRIVTILEWWKKEQMPHEVQNLLRR